jgi:hypothetical protein
MERGWEQTTIEKQNSTETVLRARVAKVVGVKPKKRRLKETENIDVVGRHERSTKNKRRFEAGI